MFHQPPLLIPRYSITLKTDNIIITGDLNGKHTNFNCTKTDTWLWNWRQFYIMQSLHCWKQQTHTQTPKQILVTIDYVIASPAIYNNIQNLTVNNDLSSDHSAIVFDFSTNIKSTPLPIKVKLYHKPDWDSVNSSSLAKQLAFL